MGGVMFFLSAYSQDTRSLKIGDTVPNFLLSNIVNNQKNIKYLYDDDKPIILDFFGTHCGYCISLLPGLNEIQAQNKGSLSIYVVAFESEEIIRHFLKSNPKAKGISLPFITNDKNLNKLFRHRSDPHEVWIGKDHVVKAISSDNYLNQRNIQKLISGSALHLPIKEDFVEYDPINSFEKYDQRNRLIFSSALRRHIDNLPLFYHRTINLKDSINKKLIFSNCSLLDIIQTLSHYKYEGNRFVLDIKDSSRLLPLNTNINDHWAFDNSYCYELTVPRTLSDSMIWQYVLNDIGRALNLKIKLSKRKTSCFEIVNRGKQAIKSATKGERPMFSLPHDGQPAKMQNKPIATLVKAMNASNLKKPIPIVLDGTGINYNVDMILDVSDIQNLPEVDKALRPYGLKLIKTKRLIDQIVISDL